MNNSYKPEEYWTQVGERIEARSDDNVIAGDDEPFYRYKRLKFLHLLNKLEVINRSVIEVGCGPGGNLNELTSKNPSRLVGADISAKMLNLAKSRIPPSIELVKTNGETLPFQNSEFNIVFSATVLQHNTDEKMLENLIYEMCRISSDKVYIFERIEKVQKGDELCMGRPVSEYSNLFLKNNFKLINTEFINIDVSYFVCGIIRKLFNRNKNEGEPMSKLAYQLQNLLLPITIKLDLIIKMKRDLAKLEFVKIM